MCEYVDSNVINPNQYRVPADKELDMGDMTITNLGDKGQGFWECWHPETKTWEAMYPPPPGMGLYMTPGSKIRYNTKTPKPDHTKNTPPPEKTPAGTQMRDLIPK
jgi:hypothetical protein